VPYAAVALELGLPYRVDDDGLLLDAPDLLEVVAIACARTPPGEPPLLALAASARDSGLEAGLTAALLSWAAPFAELGALRHGLEERLERRARLAEAEGAITLATFHGTKGLEWDHVVCVGHDEGIFPAARALREAADPQRVLEEERRLAYVAWTRARRTLTIVYDPGAPSRFLREAFDREELA
jgi:hypothetical protein